MRSKDERGRGGESKWLKEAVIYVFVYVNRGGNGRRGWGMGPRKGGEMAGGSGTGDGSVWWIFCCNFKKGTRVSGSFAREACQGSRLHHRLSLMRGGKGKAEGRHEGNEQVKMNGKRGEAGAG